MPEKGTTNVIQNSFSAGEISPALYGRTDLAKYHQAAALMRNFFVDYKGGASTRPGTQYMGQGGSTGYVRLIPFQFSAAVGQSYMLVFTDQKLQFIKNPGGNSYPNSSNAAFIVSGGGHYEVTTPYVEADLPYLKFTQIADEMWITRHGYTRRVLKRIADTNWTLTTVSTTPTISAPTGLSATVTALPAGSTDPQQTRQIYRVTAVDADGNESLPSVPVISPVGINIATTQGTVSVFWTAVANAVYYKVYKGLASLANIYPTESQAFGFAGYVYGTTFTDTNIVPDFTKGPPSAGDPFDQGRITGFAITAAGTTYPVGATSLTVSDATGSGAVLYPILDTNVAGGTGGIVGIYIDNPGKDYTAPTVSATGAGGSGFTATLSIGATSNLDPDVVGLFQQRLIYASSTNFPNTLWGSRPSAFADFRSSNPIVDDDAYIFTVASPQVNDIVWLLSMPGGLVVGTNSGIVQLTGGSAAASNPTAVTPTSAVFVPQSRFGATDLDPIAIDYNILFVQAENSIVRDLQYNFFVNIYTGTDITAFSSHLFFPNYILSWAYQDSPFKVIWAALSNGQMLSLTYLKEQEILGWSWHDTQGYYESIATVREGVEDATYVAVRRTIGGNTVRTIERMCGRQYFMVDDAWCLDAALSTQPVFPAANLQPSSIATGTVTAVADANVFAPSDVGKVLRVVGTKGVVTGYTSPTEIILDMSVGFGAIPDTTTPALQPSGLWRLDPVVSTLSGLGHLEGLQVMALVDGVPQGPFTVSSGTITLTTPGSAIVAGLTFQPQLKTLYLDVGGEGTIQGMRKKPTAATIRVKDTAGLKYGIDFDQLITWIQGQSSTDPQIIPTVPGLVTGDNRLALPQRFTTVGQICIQQDNPLPATVLAVIPEVAMGDT